MSRFKKAVSGSDYCFPYILISYPNEAIGISNDDFSDKFHFG
jgi:hypothetical protein